MPVTNTKLISNTLQADGRRLVLYEFTDHLGVARLGSSKLMPADFDRSADADSETQRHDDMLVRLEETQALTSNNVMSFVNNPKHSTTRGVARRLIRHIAIESDLQELRKFGDFIRYLQSNLTPGQARTFLKITNRQLTRLNKKMNAILASEAELENIESSTGRIR